MMISLSGNILVLSSLLFLFGYVKGMYIKSINFYDDDEMIYKKNTLIVNRLSLLFIILVIFQVTVSRRMVILLGILFEG